MDVKKVLFVIALIAGYVYVSNQDYQDQQLLKQQPNAINHFKFIFG